MPTKYGLLFWLENIGKDHPTTEAKESFPSKELGTSSTLNQIWQRNTVGLVAVRFFEMRPRRQRFHQKSVLDVCTQYKSAMKPHGVFIAFWCGVVSTSAILRKPQQHGKEVS